jgi:hypothetical protein
MTEDQLQRLKQLADNAAHEASHLRFGFFREDVEAFIHIVYLKGYIDALKIKAVPAPFTFDADNPALVAFGHNLVEEIRRVAAWQVPEEKPPKKK